MKSGFVNIFGKPNSGKSTLLNALIGEKLAIVSPKVQTTRHRIKGFVTTKDYQVIFSDTPGIINPKYKLHEKMMQAVKGALEDADIAILLVDIHDDWKDANSIFESLHLKVPVLLVINKIDGVQQNKQKDVEQYFKDQSYVKHVLRISALNGMHIKELFDKIIDLLPEGQAFYSDDELSDMPTRFFISEIIREKIFELFEDEIPYHTTVMVNEFKQKASLVKIGAEIIVQRESQKAIIIGEGGKMIKMIGIEARKDIEKFIDQKAFLELFVKVRPKWRENELFLKEYGY